MIKAIETHYQGYRFRSRLEARWAVFFDALGIEWEYEKEGYQLWTGWYLPDFWLPQFRFYAEIKPKELKIWEHEAGIHNQATGGDWSSFLPAVLFNGLPPGDSHGRVYVDGLDDLCEWVVCEKCNEPGFGYCCGGEYTGVFSCGCNAGLLYLDSPRQSAKLSHAVIAARSARFEHGEQPNVY